MKIHIFLVALATIVSCSNGNQLKFEEYSFSKVEPIYIPSIHYSRNPISYSLEEEFVYEIYEILNKNGYVVRSEEIDSESETSVSSSVRSSVKKAMGHEDSKRYSFMNECTSYLVNQSPCLEIRFFYKPSPLLFENGDLLRVVIKLRKNNHFFISDLEWKLSKERQNFEANKMAKQLLGGIPL